MAKELKRCKTLRNSQRGLVLFVSLAIFILLSLLVMVTLSVSLKDTKKVSNMRNIQLAELAANSAMSEAKAEISGIAEKYGATQVCSHVICAIRNATTTSNAAAFMQTPIAQAVAIRSRIDFNALKGSDESAHLASPPTYVIEDLGAWHLQTGSSLSDQPSHHDFRITARGTGNTSDVARIVESVYLITN